MMLYIIPLDIVSQFQNMSIDCFRLRFRMDKTGRYVINVGCGEEHFPEIPWEEFEQEDMTTLDFNNSTPDQQ